eukprot:303659_1
MRKYIIFLIVLFYYQLLRTADAFLILPCNSIVMDWYRSGKCLQEDGRYREEFQAQCWTCTEADPPTGDYGAGSLVWGGEYGTKGYLVDRICPQIKTAHRLSHFYVWRGAYPPVPLYASRTGGGSASYSAMTTQLEFYQRHGQFRGRNPCAGSPVPAGRRAPPPRQFSTCMYTIKCRDTHEADPAPPRIKAKAPPGKKRGGAKVKVKAATGKEREREIPQPPPRASEKTETASSDPHRASSVDFDDMLHYYIGEISDYLNNEYTDYDGYDLDDQFGEMLMDMYMEGYKAGLNVERKWS